MNENPEDKTRKLVSVVVPAYNEAPGLPEFHRRLGNVLDALPLNSEVIYVNDGSTDETMAVMGTIRSRDHRVSILDRKGQLLARFGHPEEGEEPGKFISPHGIAVDSHGDIYVGEVSFTTRGRKLNPPREMKSLKKLRKL